MDTTILSAIKSGAYDTVIDFLEQSDDYDNSWQFYLGLVTRKTDTSEAQKQRLQVLDKAWRKKDRAEKIKKLREKTIKADAKEMHRLLAMIDDHELTTVILHIKKCTIPNSIVDRGWEFMKKALDKVQNNEEYLQLVALLLEIGVHPEVQLTQMHTSPLQRAQKENNMSVLKLFYTYFPKLDPTQQKSALEKESSWKLTKEEQTFLKIQEIIDKDDYFEDDTTIEKVLTQFKEACKVIDATYCYYAVLRGFEKDYLATRDEYRYIQDELQTPAYQDWRNENTVTALLTANNLNTSAIALEQISKYVAIHDKVRLLSKKEFYTTQVEDGTAEESFEEYIHHYGFYLFLNKESQQANAEDIKTLEQLSSRTFPKALKEFYMHIGNLHVEESFSLFSVHELMESLNEENPYHKLSGLGIIDMLIYSWGGVQNRPEFTSEYGKLTQENITFLNTTYTCFGYVLICDHTLYALYYDLQGNFGAISYNQDSFTSLLEDYLTPMLTQSLAHHSLWEVLVTLLAEHSIYNIGVWGNFSMYDDWDTHFLLQK